jgi:hypothetical protein
MAAKSRHGATTLVILAWASYNTLLQGISCLSSSVPLARGPVTSVL